MKYEKPLSDKARFWIGIVACAFVGWVASTVSYFYSKQEIQNEYNPYWYRNNVYYIFDENECNSLKMNEKTTVNTDVVIKNGNSSKSKYPYMPILVRVRYAVGNVDDGYEQWKTESGKSFYVTRDICNSVGSDSSYCKASAKNAESFLYNEKDGAYYYKGILEPLNFIQHLDSLTFRAEWDSDEETGLTTFTSAWYGEMYLHKDDSWYYSSKDNVGRGVSLGTGATQENSINDNSLTRRGLKIIVDVVGATDGKGNTLELTGNEDADKMESYWNDLNLRLPAYGEYGN